MGKGVLQFGPKEVGLSRGPRPRMENRLLLELTAYKEQQIRARPGLGTG